MLLPDQLTSNGYPKSASISASGNSTLFNAPTQAVYPGHQVLIAWGASAKLKLNNNNGSSSNVACTGTTSFSAGPVCDGTGCSPFTGSIALTILTVTAAPTGSGCSLRAGVPITGVGVTISPFGTPTIITSAGSTCGSNTCYTVNQSQTVGSVTMTMGFRLEVTSVDQSDQQSTFFNAQWLVEIFQPSGTVSGIASFNINDESTYWASAAPCGGSQAKSCILGTMFRTRMAQSNVKVIRDLNLAAGNISNCTTWASRPPVNYFSWGSSEFRDAPSGNTTYTVQGHTYSIPNAGQYVNAAGTSQSGGTVSYNAGTDIYSIALGSGGPVDKQTIIMLAPATGDTVSKISLNGTTAAPILGGYGATLANSFGAYIPQSGGITALVYDADLGGFLSFGGSGLGNIGLNCGIPPEVAIEINAELGTVPWHVPGYMSLDAATDWVTQYAIYLKANYTPPSKPIFEPANEPWNCSAANAVYVSVKSEAHILADINHAWSSGGFCGSAGNYNQEIGKLVSTVGQDLVSVYGAGNFETGPSPQTGFGGASSFNDMLLSTAYIGQSMAPQSGYSQVAAYTIATRAFVNNYWHMGYYCNDSASVCGNEVGLAWCYEAYAISTACQGLYASQAVVMTLYMNSATASISGVNNIAKLVTQLAQWNAWAALCASGSRPGNCTMNVSSPSMMYEGGLDAQGQSSDVAQTVSAANNASQAVLTVTANGCVVGQAVALSGLSGGTWPSAAGSYEVTAVPDANHCTINLNSTSLGTLSSATLTYTGSAGYITFFRNIARTSPELDTLTTTVYNDVLANGGINPSQFGLSNTDLLTNPTNGAWFVFAADIYGYMPVAQCTGCTIASSILTLGGTINGVFRVGDTLFGGSVAGVGTGAGSNTTITSCTAIGSNPCGTTAGDILGLSQASTVSSGETMTGNVTPPANQAENSTTSPVRAWGSICRFNGNGNQCNGWLLKRDLDAGSNDNDPMWLENAA